MPGLQVGQADDPKIRTGVTVIVPDGRATCAVDVRGGGPGTRETDALNSWNLVHSIDAVVLSGGSVYGLAAADGVAAWLGAHDRGYGLSTAPGVPVSPIVPAAILYDLANQGDKAWGLDPPYRALGIRAIETASRDFKLGTAGAGYGAETGATEGRRGLGVLRHQGRHAAWAPSSRSTAWARLSCRGQSNSGPGPSKSARNSAASAPAAPRVFGEDWGQTKVNPGARTNTTIACIATDVELDIDQMKRVTMMAQDGLSRAIRPIHSPFDGDVVFGLSTAQQKMKGPSAGFHGGADRGARRRCAGARGGARRL